MGSAMTGEPPTPTKLALIRSFLRLNGTQSAIDAGSFVQRLVFHQTAIPRLGSATLEEAMAAVLAAYEKHRPAWQAEYEAHVDWEFTEQELAEIVAFLERDTGQHYREGIWRMEAYVGTNTEDLLEQIVSEAAELVSARRK